MVNISQNPSITSNTLTPENLTLSKTQFNLDFDENILKSIKYYHCQQPRKSWKPSLSSQYHHEHQCYHHVITSSSTLTLSYHHHHNHNHHHNMCISLHYCHIIIVIIYVYHHIIVITSVYQRINIVVTTLYTYMIGDLYRLDGAQGRGRGILISTFPTVRIELWPGSHQLYLACRLSRRWSLYSVHSFTIYSIVTVLYKLYIKSQIIWKKKLFPKYPETL